MRERAAVVFLCALTAAMALPYAVAGPNFILDDWFALRNAMFEGAWAAAGHNQQVARPGAWVVYGLTFGFVGNHPLAIFVLQTAVTAAVAVALFFVVRRFVAFAPAVATAAVWIVAPTHTSLDNWASALNISLALLAVLLGVASLGRSRGDWVAAILFAVSALCYEATMPLAAVACLAVPLLERRRPRLADLALPSASLAASGAWIVTHWHPDKHVGGWINPSPLLAAHFGWGIATWHPLATFLPVAATAGLVLAVVRLTFPSFRPAAVEPEATVAVGLAIMAIGIIPFLRYLYSPLGAGDRVNVVSSVGAALVVTGLGWMTGRAARGRVTRALAIAAAVVVAATATATNVHRDRLYARAGDDVLRTMNALDRAFPHPEGPIALGPTPVITDNIGGLLDESNVDGALQVHRGHEGVRGYVTDNEAAWRRAPANLRFDQVRFLRPSH
ncbi:MAG: hypothetical protein QOG90_614 [Actinomycetota bacterium]|jgi:hypothetical protein